MNNTTIVHKNLTVKILVMMICALSMLDTQLFVYSSLSYSLLSGSVITLLMIATLYKCRCKLDESNNVLSFFITAWIIYIVVYSNIVNSEQYRVWYIVSSLLFALALSMLLRKCYVQWGYIENIVLLLAGLNCVVIGFQFSGVIKSSNPFITITGINANPSSTAIYLIGALVVILNRLIKGNHKVIYISSYLLLTCIIAVLKCRTAYIGFVILNIIYGFYWLRTKTCICTKYNYVGSFILLSIAILMIVGLYNFKKGSSQGRIFIWKNTVDLIREHPTGYGYGMFQKTYNLAQSRYFQYNNGTDEEKEHADFVAMPYNDYLESGIEGGIIGMTFYALFFVLMILYSYKKKDVESFSFFLAFMFMATVNFVYTSVSVWILIMCFCAQLMSHLSNAKSERGKLLQKYSFLTVVFIVLIGILFSYKNMLFVNSQLKLNKIHNLIKDGQSVGDLSLLVLQKNIGTSEAYYNTLGSNYILQGDYNNAVTSILEAQKYSSSPEVFYGLWDVYMRMHQEKKAIECLKIVANMQPVHLLPKLYIMRSYIVMGNKKMGIQYANSIVSTKAKIKNEMASEIYNEAHKYINDNNCGLRDSRKIIIKKNR